ncbi:MAG TPA: type II toxin-antitoxin system VapC family toxin [Allosphingosinicella sp.]
MVEPLYLLDSNICIYVLQDAGSPAALRIAQFRPGTVVASAVTYAEVARGVAPDDQENLTKLDAFFRAIPVLPFDQNAARTYASIPFRRGTFDRLIAAHALSLGLTVVTNNERDYADVAGLQIENWTDS